MRIASINIRGFGGRIKRSSIRELVNTERVEFLCIQETKLDKFDERLASVLWGNKDCNWVYSSTDGALGGLCCLWDKSIF